MNGKTISFKGLSETENFFCGWLITLLSKKIYRRTSRQSVGTDSIIFHIYDFSTLSEIFSKLLGLENKLKGYFVDDSLENWNLPTSITT